MQSNAENEFELKCSPVFDLNWRSNKFVCVNRGGTRSGKTYSILSMAVFFLFHGEAGEGFPIYNTGTFSVIRKYSASLDKSALKDFEDILTEYDLLKYLKVNKTLKTFTYKRRTVQFIGADDTDKLRGIKHTVAYFNEANECDFEAFTQVAFRTECRIIIDFNPDDDQIWINTQIEQLRQSVMKDVDVFVSSYKDNPFLTARQVSEIEQMKETNPEAWEVFGLGNYGKIRGLIFPNWEVCDKVPDGAKLIGRGLDFGFTNHPSALIDVYESGGALYVDEVFYERGLTNPDIAARVKQTGSGEVIADSAEPKSIEEIYRASVNIHPALKGKDSITNSIDILKRYKVYMTARSTNVHSERRTYKWHEDKNGNKLNEPVDYNNHALDAIRYVAMNKLGDHTRPTGEYWHM